MARNDGIDRTVARNINLTASKIANAQRHNEREKESYTNPDIVPERISYNVHFKTPTGSYAEMFEQMKTDGVISTRGLKEDANLYGELIFDVNSAYFYNHGGYEFAKQFYADAYKAAVEIVGDEQYILSAVMHADERNRAMSEALGEDVYHYDNVTMQYSGQSNNSRELLSMMAVRMGQALDMEENPAVKSYLVSLYRASHSYDVSEHRYTCEGCKERVVQKVEIDPVTKAPTIPRTTLILPTCPNWLRG